MNPDPTLPLTIRPAYPDDAPALRRLAALDSSLVPPGQLLVAELDGELRVAVSLDDLTVIADPFTRTVEIVELLRAHVQRSTKSATRLSRRQVRRLALQSATS